MIQVGSYEYNMAELTDTFPMDYRCPECGSRNVHSETKTESHCAYIPSWEGGGYEDYTTSCHLFACLDCGYADADCDGY